MQNFDTQWTREELKAYVLIYGAHADFEESPEEIGLIVSKLGEEIYAKMHSQFANDNDHQSISKIQSSLERLAYSQNEKIALLMELKKLFKSDGDFDIQERNLFSGLERLLT